MIHKIYFGDHPIFLSTSLDEISEEYADFPDAIFLKDLSETSLATCWRLLETPGDHPCFYLYHNMEKLMTALLSSTHSIEAAGGVVFTNSDEILLIFRRGKWDLPKGKVDPGETIMECALREVMEETGLQTLTLMNKIGSSFYCYRENGQAVFKQVQWFKMIAANNDNLVPQAEEDITELKWVSVNDLEPYLQNTYATIKDVLLLAQRSPDGVG
jgi:8-oxo-dGTP pyrophosphatase MutT (NUDIX family)